MEHGGGGGGGGCPEKQGAGRSSEGDGLADSSGDVLLPCGGSEALEAGDGNGGSGPVEEEDRKDGSVEFRVSRRRVFGPGEPWASSWLMQPEHVFFLGCGCENDPGRRAFSVRRAGCLGLLDGRRFRY